MSKKLKAHQREPLEGFSVGTFPLYDEQLQWLIGRHKKLKRCQLRLALWYDMDDPLDIRLLEVFENFPAPDLPGELFSAYYNSSAEFLIALGGRLIVTMASPRDLLKAARKQSEIVMRVQRAFRRHQARSIYCSRSARHILNQVKGAES